MHLNYKWIQTRGACWIDLRGSVMHHCHCLDVVHKLSLHRNSFILNFLQKQKKTHVHSSIFPSNVTAIPYLLSIHTIVFPSFVIGFVFVFSFSFYSVHALVFPPFASSDRMLAYLISSHIFFFGQFSGHLFSLEAFSLEIWSMCVRSNTTTLASNQNCMVWWNAYAHSYYYWLWLPVGNEFTQKPKIQFYCNVFSSSPPSCAAAASVRFHWIGCNR